MLGLLRSARSRGFSRASLARACNLNPGTLRLAPWEPGEKLEGSGFNPTLSTVRNIEALLGVDDVDDAPTGRALSVQESGMLSGVISTKVRRGEKSINVKHYVTQDHIVDLDPAFDFLMRLIHHETMVNGRLVFDERLFHAASAGAPSCLFHVLAQDNDGEMFFARWHHVDEYRGGMDLTGQRVSSLGDDALTDCTRDDFLVCRSYAMPHLSVLARRQSWGGSIVDRVFPRIMCGGESLGGSPQVLVIRGAIQESSPSPYLGDNFIAA